MASIKERDYRTMKIKDSSIIIHTWCISICPLEPMFAERFHYGAMQFAASLQLQRVMRGLAPA
jgi:hypothetical protein